MTTFFYTTLYTNIQKIVFHSVQNIVQKEKKRKGITTLPLLIFVLQMLIMFWCSGYCLLLFSDV